MKETLINQFNIVYGAVGLSGFWSTFQDNVKYVIFGGTIWFMIKEWKSKAIGKMLMVFAIGAILFVLTLDPQTVLQPIGNKLLEMVGAK